MASEPTEEGGIRVELPTELEDWLHARATDLDVDPQDVLVQLLSTYRAAETMEDGAGGLDDLDVEVSGGADFDETIEAVVRGTIAEAVGASADDELEAALESTLETLVGEAVEAELEAQEAWQPAGSKEAVDELRGELDDRLETARADFHEKLEDVRERVIQVKREVDDKAPAEHDHEAFGRLETVEEELGALEATVADLESELEAIRSEVEAVGEDAQATDETLADLEERLTTVAWVVSDLREAQESETGEATLRQLKRDAAAADVSRAKCENCGEGVEIGLLQEPACPHCEATVTTVEPSRGFFGSPRLLVAAQLESGEER